MKRKHQDSGWSPHSGTQEGLWGADSSSVYAVGYGGYVTHFDGSQWNHIPSPTTIGLGGIWGVRDGSNVETVLCTGLKQGIFEITGSGVQNVFNWPGGEASGLWFKNLDQVFVTGSGGVYVFSRGNWLQSFYCPYLVSGIRGTQVNDLFILGDGVAAHWNGSSWHEYPQFESYNPSLVSVDVKDDLVIAVGLAGNPLNQTAVAVIGKHP